jgi:hypothetical protein
LLLARILCHPSSSVAAPDHLTFPNWSTAHQLTRLTLSTLWQPSGMNFLPDGWIFQTRMIHLWVESITEINHPLLWN